MGTAGGRDIYLSLERCQLPLRRLQTFLGVEDRAICISSHSPTNLSSLWSEISRGSVHHHHQWTWTPQLATLSTPCCTVIRFGYKIIGNWRRLRYDTDDNDLDLDLDSTRIQLDRLDHTPTPSMSAKSCHFWGENRAGSSRQIFCRSLLTVLLLFALGRPGPLLYPSSATPAVSHSHHMSMSKPSKSSFSQYVASGLFPIAIRLHCTGELAELLLRTTLSSTTNGDYWRVNVYDIHVHTVFSSMNTVFWVVTCAGAHDQSSAVGLYVATYMPTALPGGQVSESVGFTGSGARFACYPVSDPQRIAWSGETKAVHGDRGNYPVYIGDEPSPAVPTWSRVAVCRDAKQPASVRSPDKWSLSVSYSETTWYADLTRATHVRQKSIDRLTDLPLLQWTGVSRCEVSK